MLTLYRHALIALAEDQIDTTIRICTAKVGDNVSEFFEHQCHQLLELKPVDRQKSFMQLRIGAYVGGIAG